MRRSFSRIVAVLAAIAALGNAAVLPRPAAAAEAGPPGAVLAETDAPAQPAAATGDFWTRDTLLGDIAGLRSAIAPYGVTLGLSETSEILGNLTGGRRRGAIYEGVSDLNLRFDLQPYFHWRGVFFARAFQIHGRGLTANELSNLNTASNLEATRTTRLFEFWYEQHLSDWLGIRIGQQGADREFLISSTARLFVNATFGWPTLPAADLPSGGPAYPLGTPAIRFRVDANEDLSLLAGLFNGDPVGPGTGDPQRRDLSGTAFRTSDGVFAIVETRYNPGNSKQNGTYRLGAWFNSERFLDLHFDTHGVSLASPASTGQPRLHPYDYSLYAIVDQPILRDNGSDSGFAVFARAMGAPADRNLVDLYLDGGLTYNGPFGRTDDQVGIGLGYARIGSSVRAFNARFGQPPPTRSDEKVLEVTYLFQLLPWWQVQPDFQYVFNPGGGIPSPAAPTRRLGDAAVFGVRTAITF
jgi:porin